MGGSIYLRKNWRAVNPNIPTPGNPTPSGVGGCQVFSTVPGGYAYFAGTSMAAPQVTGLVGLVRELDPDTNANQVENVIERGAEGSGRGDPETGAGRINARRTVESL